MDDKTKATLGGNSLNRREFLKIAGIAGATIGLGGGLGGLIAACGGTTTSTSGATTTTLAGSSTTAAAVTTTAPASGGSTTSVAVGNSPLKIAFLTDLSGGSSLFGAYMNTVGRAVVDDMNLAGVKGFSKIEVKTYDTRSDPGTYVEQVNRAKLQDGMHVSWGDWVSTYILPASNDAKLPNMTNNPSGVKLLPDSNRFMVDINPSSFEYGLSIADFMKKNSVKKWAIAGQGWGEGWMQSYAAGIRVGGAGSGFECVYDKECPGDQVDWTALINEWKNTQPEVVVTPWPGDGTFSIIKQMKDMGFKPKYFIVEQLFPGDYTVTVKALDKSYLLGLYAMSFTDLESPGYNAWIKKELDIGFKPYGNSAEILDGLQLIKQAAEKIGPEGVKDGATFAAALRDSSYDGALGYPVGPFDEALRLKNVNVFMYQCVDGSPDWTTEYTHHWAKVFSSKFDHTTSYEQGIALDSQLKSELG
jgi:ABC-type branched-subunit amino acid transport system substrate-binding protein